MHSFLGAAELLQRSKTARSYASDALSRQKVCKATGVEVSLHDSKRFGKSASHRPDILQSNRAKPLLDRGGFFSMLIDLVTISSQRQFFSFFHIFISKYDQFITLSFLLNDLSTA